MNGPAATSGFSIGSDGSLRSVDLGGCGIIKKLDMTPDPMDDVDIDEVKKLNPELTVFDNRKEGTR